jgi:hypothetical protein
MIATESPITSPASSITGTSPWPLTASTGARFVYSIITDWAAMPLCARAKPTRSQLVDHSAR